MIKQPNNLKSDDLKQSSDSAYRKNILMALATVGLLSVSSTACTVNVSVKKSKIKHKKLEVKPQPTSLVSLKNIYNDITLLNPLFKKIGHDKLLDSADKRVFFGLVKKYVGESAVYSLDQAFEYDQKKNKLKRLVQVMSMQIQMFQRHIQSNERLIDELKKNKKANPAFVLATESKVIDIRVNQQRLKTYLSKVNHYISTLSDH